MSSLVRGFLKRFGPWLVVFVLATHVTWAKNWMEFDAGYYKVDLDSVQRNGHLVEFWSSVEDGMDVEYNLLNCQTRQIKALKRYNAQGQIEYPAETDKWGQWWTPDPYVGGEDLLHYFCTP